MSKFDDVIRDAIRDIEEHGFDSQERLDRWVAQIRQAAKESLVSDIVLQKMLDSYIKKVYASQIEKGAILRGHREIPAYRLEMVKPKLHAELDRRIRASANLIKMNREEMIHKTLQRFSGWATSVPVGGSDAVEFREVSNDVKKSIKQLPFAERRVMIDQGHKFMASLNEILATDNDALAMVWHSHWRQPGYNYRKDHKERDKQIYVIRSNWALEKGLMKLAGREYYDDVTHVGEEVFCQCYATWIYNIRDLPDDMLTSAGKEALKRR